MKILKKLHVYNFYTRSLEEFKSIFPNKVGMYVCGPTVSGESHLGHTRPFISFDIVFRYLKHLGYDVRYVRNITDAGHFEEVGRDAEDKITAKAQLEMLEPMELVTKYVRMFHQSMDALNCLPPSIEPSATGHIIEQIEMIKIILEKGYAYEVNGSIYFDTIKYAKHYDYGKLSGRILDDLIDNTRELTKQDEKRNSADFALWKKAPPKHLMRWESPWGEGFPGWHIECSAMSKKYLGQEFDIHGGGLDLLFPHHEAEIAQSAVCCNDKKTPAQYWLYNNMITIEGVKMGKSYNNQIKLSDMFSGNDKQLSQAYSPMTVRFFILQSHYRSTLDFSNDALQASEKGLARLLATYKTLMGLSIQGTYTAKDEMIDAQINQKIDQFDQAMNNDFNTAMVISQMFDLCPRINAMYTGQLPLQAISSSTMERLQTYFRTYLIDILGISVERAESDISDRLIEIIIQFRNNLKSKKEYQWSDTIRHELEQLGIQLKDEKNGKTTFEYT